MHCKNKYSSQKDKRNIKITKLAHIFADVEECGRESVIDEIWQQFAVHMKHTTEVSAVVC